jgi:hypothetical protein
MPIYKINTFNDSQHIKFSNNIESIIELKNELAIKKNLYYQNIKIINNNIELEDDININNLPNKEFYMCIIPIKCKVHYNI